VCPNAVCTWQTRPVSSVERWLCSRLYSTVLQCERGLEAYELSSVTAAIHSFWVHSLCDVYLVRTRHSSPFIVLVILSIFIDSWVVTHLVLVLL